MIASLYFPWPPKELSPNARVHWAKKAKIAKRYKLTCYLLHKSVVGLHDKRTFRYVFCAPDNRRRDDDNIIASWKFGQDALSDLTGVDDSKFEWSFARGEPVKGGAVIVEVLG